MTNKNCAVCQKCCTGTSAPSLTIMELCRLIDPIAEYLGDCLYKLQSPCQYHSPDVGCTLDTYTRPLACKLYPFFPTGAKTNNPEEKETWVVKTSCPWWMTFTAEDLEEAKETLEKQKDEFMLFRNDKRE